MSETSASIKYIDRRSVSPYLGSFDFSSYFDFAIDGTWTGIIQIYLQLMHFY